MKHFLKETTTCAEMLAEQLKEAQKSPTKETLLEIREKTLSVLGDVDYLLRNIMKNNVKQLLSEALGEKTTINHYQLQEWLTTNLNVENAEANSFISEAIDNNFQEIWTKEQLEDLLTK